MVVRDFEIVENYRPHPRVEADVDEGGLEAFARDGYLYLPSALDSNQTLALADAVERVGIADGAADVNVARAHTCTRRAIASTISAAASASGTPFFCVPSR